MNNIHTGIEKASQLKEMHLTGQL